MRPPPAPGAVPLHDALAATRPHFVAAAVFSGLMNLLLLAPTLYMLQVYDRAVPTQGKLTLFFLTLVVLFALGVLALLELVRSRILLRAGVRLDRLLAPRLLEATFANTGGGQLGKMAVREFDTLRQALTGPAAIALLDAPWTPIYALVCFIIHPALGLMAVAGGAVLILLTWRSEQATRATIVAAGRAANAAYLAHDSATTASSVVRALGMRHTLVARQLRDREQALLLQTQATYAGGGYVSTTRFVRMALQSLALGLGALLAIDNQISGGAIFAASFLVARSMGPIEQLVGAWKSVVQARSAWTTLTELFTRAPQAGPRTQLPAPTGRVDVERLTVFNKARDQPVLRDVTFGVSPGEIVAIVGPSGAGKSTLLRAIAGAITHDRGTVRFDGAEASAWESDELGAHLGFMPQEPSLFAGTAKENIARFRSTDEPSDIVDLRVVNAAQSCGAHEMILRLPLGYETPVGWGGEGLSAGQAQQLALARALYGRPNILLLDEPNAHLDAEGEQKLTATLAAEKARGASVLIVVHRTSILAVVDKLLVMRDGAVEMFGPRDEVLRRIAPAPPATVQTARR